MLDQGKEWTESHRQDFYSRDQGSQVMPLPWLKALRQPDGTPFLADSLARYGYLPNPKAPAEGLPVGFTVAGTGARQMVGMTCSACHTRQIEVRALPIGSTAVRRSSTSRHSSPTSIGPWDR